MLGQALDGGRAHAVEHHRQRELVGVEERSHPVLEGLAHGADAGADTRDRTPEPADMRDAQLLAGGLDVAGLLARDRDGAVHAARLHEPLAEGESLVEEGHDIIRGDIDPLLVALEAQDLVGIDANGQPLEDEGLGGPDGEDLAHRRRRERTTSAMRRTCAGPEPQQPPTMLQPASSSAGYSFAMASGPSS